MHKKGRSEGFKLPKNAIICSDNGASYASDLPEGYFNKNYHFIVTDGSEVYGDSCPICRRRRK